MSKLLWTVCFGLCCWISVSQAHYVISCRFWGVFHVEKGVRYNQTAEEARKTCGELDAAIATEKQMMLALESGFEICRYGWIDNNTVAIPRITPNSICASNHVGLYAFHPNLTTQFDVFCYNASDHTEKNCEQYDYRNKSIPSHDPTEEEFPGTQGYNENEDPPTEDIITRDASGSPQSKQKRRAAIPDWLIVCVSLVCLGLIFSVCIALNARRICGQKKKLVINGNKGSLEDGVIMEQNGDTVKSQEMVQLVSKEQTNELGDQEEPLTQDDVRNAKDVDMKIGV
ncbi:CD44 antigen isoform 2-T2 [Mantella aurantiaca]